MTSNVSPFIFYPTFPSSWLGSTICFGYDSRLGAWGDFRYKADITHIISTIGIGNWVKVVKDMATDKAPNIVFK